MHIFDVIIFFKLHTMQLGTFSFHQLPGTQPTKISWFNCFLLYCTQLEKDEYIENLHVLSCSILLKSILLISCVFWIFFSERWQSTLFQIFFFFHHNKCQRLSHFMTSCKHSVSSDSARAVRELPQHFFISQLSSLKMCKGLVNLLSSRRLAAQSNFQFQA